MAGSLPFLESNITYDTAAIPPAMLVAMLVNMERRVAYVSRRMENNFNISVTQISLHPSRYVLTNLRLLW
jgi:hypothetical protein